MKRAILGMVAGVVLVGLGCLFAVARDPGAPAQEQTPGAFPKLAVEKEPINGSAQPGGDANDADALTRVFVIKVRRAGEGTPAAQPPVPPAPEVKAADGPALLELP